MNRSGIPDDLFADLEAEVHRFFGHDGDTGDQGEWVAEFVSALAPHIARAITDASDEAAWNAY